MRCRDALPFCGLAALAWVAACEPAPPAEPSPSSSVALSAAAPSVSSVAQPPRVSGLQTKVLQRKAEPAALFAKNETDCKAGDPAACRALANRYAGRRDQVGCGVPRKRPFPSLKSIPVDDLPDHDRFDLLEKDACNRGDQQACLGKWNDRPPGLFDKEPRWKKQPEAKLPPELLTKVAAACQETHSCDFLYVALDRWGYPPAELAPVREAFAKTLVDACVEGECTCGDAGKFLPADDPRRTDLGILGCENGEAEGCYLLGRAYEAGNGVPKDEKKARSLYDLACPPLQARTWTGAIQGEISTHACDRIAEIAIGDSYPGKDRVAAKYYAQAACRGSFDHAPCVRLAMLWATRPTSAGGGKNAHEARVVAMGETYYGAANRYDDDCRRPSVATECAALKEALTKAK